MKSKVQPLPLSRLVPSKNNVRRFIDPDGLTSMVELYRAHARGERVILPPHPVVRPLYEDQKWTGKYEIVSGERRVTAAHSAGLERIECHEQQMTDEEAYLFSLAANDNEPITVVEKAIRAADMVNMGYEEAVIEEALGGGSPYRYIAVGNMVDPLAFADTPKLCDPSITLWYEASCRGKDHFDYCFRNWNLGLWDEDDCAKYFRATDTQRPLDNKAKGLRISISKDGRELNVIGKINLDMYSDAEVKKVVNTFVDHLIHVADRGVRNRVVGFGEREVLNINPDTV